MLLLPLFVWDNHCKPPHQGNHQQQPSCLTGNGRALSAHHKRLVVRVVDEDFWELMVFPRKILLYPLTSQDLGMLEFTLDSPHDASPEKYACGVAWV